MAVYTDKKIKEWAKDNVLPYNEKLVNPASIDLTLGNKLKRPMWYWRYPISRFIAWHLRNLLKVKYWDTGIEFTTYTLWPGEFVLCHSLEWTNIPTDAIALLFSKSSTGRTGLEHLHAGYGDPEFKGEWTWELENVAPWPIQLVAGKALMQVALIGTMGVPEKLYGQVGRYQNQRGPQEECPEKTL